jgi:CRP/FNR family cyclic AMP-dependent transcriptional regulator
VIRREDLQGNRLFGEFASQEVDLVRVVVEEAFFKDGDVIIREGEPGKRLYLIAEGKCSVTTQIAGAGTEEIKLMEPGDFFGEMSLMESAPVSATVFARGRCRLLWIDRKAFDRLIDEDMPIANKLLKAIARAFCERTRETAAKLESYYRLSKF